MPRLIISFALVLACSKPPPEAALLAESMAQIRGQDAAGREVGASSLVGLCCKNDSAPGLPYEPACRALSELLVRVDDPSTLTGLFTRSWSTSTCTERIDPGLLASLLEKPQLDNAPALRTTLVEALAAQVATPRIIQTMLSQLQRPAGPRDLHVVVSRVLSNLGDEDLATLVPIIQQPRDPRREHVLDAFRLAASQQLDIPGLEAALSRALAVEPDSHEIAATLREVTAAKHAPASAQIAELIAAADTSVEAIRRLGRRRIARCSTPARVTLQQIARSGDWSQSSVRHAARLALKEAAGLCFKAAQTR